MLIKYSNTSNVLRFTLKHSTSGIGLTGLTEASAGLIISIISNNEATATIYTQAGSTIETIAALGTYAAPTAAKCRFKEVDATNHKGLYEFHFADARFAVTDARSIIISVTGATNLLDADYEIQLVSFDPYAVSNLGLTRLDTTISSRSSHTVADIIAGVADGSYDLQEMMRIMFAALAGKSSGGGTATLKFRNSADDKDRIVATVDVSGNRTNVTSDGS